MKRLIFLLTLLAPVSVLAQATGSIQGYCDLGGRQATIAGLNSSNYLQGVIPHCLVSVYLTDSQTLATIYKDGSNTPLTNPFKATTISSTQTGHWLFYAAQGQGYDVQLSGGDPPLVFPSPVVAAVDVFASGGTGSGGSCSPNIISAGCTGGTSAPAAQANILGNPAAGLYAINCTSSSDCQPSILSSAFFYQTVQANTVSLTQEARLNLKSGSNSTVSCVDNPGNNSTDCTISSTGGSSVTWPTSGDLVISNGTNTPTGLPPQLNLCLGGVAGPVFGDMPCVSSLTTTGSSGAAAFNTVTGALNIPVYSSGGGGGFTPANGIFAGDSVNDDDGNVIEPTFALTGFTCTGVTCTVTNSGTNNLAAGDWVNMRFSSAWTSTFSAPTDISYSTGYTLFKVLSSGLSSTQFEFSFASSGTCASTCGVAAKATYNLPFNTANLAGLSGKLTPYVVIPNPVTEQALNTYYSTILHPLSEAVTGQPTYFIFGQLENDAFANGCTSAATIEAALQSLWAQVHADSSSVVVWSTNAVNLGQTGLGICSSGYQTLIALEQWLPLQGKSAANQASGQYWDGFVDVARVVNDPGNSSLVAGNGGFGPGGVNLAAAKIANVLLSGVSDPLDKRSDYFGSAPGVAGVGNGFMQIPTYDSVYTYQWFSASSGSTLGSQIMSLGTLFGYQHLTVNSDSPSTFNSTSQNSGNHYPSTAAVQEPSSSSTAFNYPIFGVLGPNMPTGYSIKEDLGRDNATNDVLRMQFYYAGAGSASNYAIFGLYGANGLSIDGNGNVVIQGLSPSTSPICPHGTGGALTTSGCASGSSGLSGMTATQVGVAGSSSTITSSKAIAGTGAGLASGPTSATVAGDVVTYVDTAGTQQDSSTLLSSLAPKASPTFTGTPAAPTATGGTNTTQLATTAFVQAAIAAAGTGAGIVTYSGPALTFTGTLYFPIGGGGLSSATETNVDIDSPAAVTIQNMTVQLSTAPGVGNSIAFTWRKNASSQTLTCTISGASATSCSDTTHSFTTASLDLLDIQVVTTGTVVGTPTVVMAAQVGVAATTTTAFSAISSGTNTSAAMAVGSGASLAPSGTGTVSANQLNGVPFCTGFTPTTGQNLQYTTASTPNPCYTAAAGGGSTVVAAPPYIEIGSTFYDPDMFAVTKPVICASQVFIGTGPTCTNGTNGNVVLSSTAATTNYWSKISLSSSIDIDFRQLCAAVGTNNCNGGIWIHDNTNGLVWSLSWQQGNASLSTATLQIGEYNCTSTCPGSVAPSFVSSVVYQGAEWFGSSIHLKLSVSGTILSYLVSTDGGATYQTIGTQTVGTIDFGGIAFYSGLGTIAEINLLSTSVI